MRNDRGHFFYWKFISFVLQFLKVPMILNDLDASFGEGKPFVFNVDDSVHLCSDDNSMHLCFLIDRWDLLVSWYCFWLLITVMAVQLWKKMFTTSKKKRLNWCCHGCIKLHFFFFFKCHCLKVRRKSVRPIGNVFLRVRWSLVLGFLKAFWVSQTEP